MPPGKAFSSLFIGTSTATAADGFFDFIVDFLFQFPLHRDINCNTVSGWSP